MCCLFIIIIIQHPGLKTSPLNPSSTAGGHLALVQQCNFNLSIPRMPLCSLSPTSGNGCLSTMPIHFRSFFFSIFFYLWTLASQTVPQRILASFQQAADSCLHSNQPFDNLDPILNIQILQRVEVANPSNPSYKEQDMDKWKIFPKAITKIEPHDIILGQNKTTSQYDRGNTTS